MRYSFRHAFFAFAAIALAATLALGTSHLWNFVNTPGEAAVAPRAWPIDSTLTRDLSLPTLVLLIHPHCPCSRATLDELAKLMTDCNGKLTAFVLMLHPAGTPANWEHTDLWTTAQSIPGVRVLVDEQGREALRFGAQTSGQALLYAADQHLLFSGGITESRGHEGDNDGRSAIAALVLGDAPPHTSLARTPVYGCPLFNASSENHGGASCCR
jgi:hypothetical protein